MRAQKMAMIPTLHLFARDSNFDEILKEVGDYQRSGGEVLFGTDAGFLPDSDPTDEFLQMNRAGLTWRQILASLTINPARRFGEGSRRGRLTKGQQADLVVLGDDPAADVHAFTNITAVFHAGRMIFQGQQSQR
jgi:imidazolonepropionase-like amidohydrolase